MVEARLRCKLIALNLPINWGFKAVRYRFLSHIILGSRDTVESEGVIIGA